mmetsp:Transcript_6750/g.7819  ORF Transcript_6750/g.7819 Transcript_6750/m.7819 type:complete len:149 (+) Transcript_6750:70-516(+)
MNIKCIIISILGLTQGGLAQDPMSPECDMLVKSMLADSDTTDMMYEEQHIVGDLCNAISRDAMLKSFVKTTASSNPCVGELITKLKSLGLVGAITDQEKCEDVVRTSLAAKRRMSIMVGEGTEDRDLFWGSIFKAVLPVLRFAPLLLA